MFRILNDVYVCNIVLSLSRVYFAFCVMFHINFIFILIAICIFILSYIYFIVILFYLWFSCCWAQGPSFWSPNLGPIRTPFCRTVHNPNQGPNLLANQLAQGPCQAIPSPTASPSNYPSCLDSFPCTQTIHVREQSWFGPCREPCLHLHGRNVSAPTFMSQDANCASSFPTLKSRLAARASLMAFSSQRLHGHPV